VRQTKHPLWTIGVLVIRQQSSHLPNNFLQDLPAADLPEPGCTSSANEQRHIQPALTVERRLSLVPRSSSTFGDEGPVQTSYGVLAKEPRLMLLP
jgi:hypothetical protein